MLGSLDCRHWKWKNWPTGWIEQYTDHSGSSTIIPEAIVDYDIWTWHAYFCCLPVSNNDTNVLKASHLFANLIEGIAPPTHYVIQGKEHNILFNWCYIPKKVNSYPKISQSTQSEKSFAMKQEWCKKDVERAIMFCSCVKNNTFLE